MNIDWQAYEDGLLSPEEKAAADELLARDPDARAELEGFRRFKSALSATSDAEPAPVARLRGRAFRPLRTKRALLWTGAAAAAAALVYAGWTGMFKEPEPDYGGPVVCSTSPKSVVEARDYLNEHTKLGLGVLDPGPYGKISTVTASPDKAEYAISVKGQVATVTVQPKAMVQLQGHRIATGGPEMFVLTSEGRLSIAWFAGRLGFRLQGLDTPNPADTVAFAQHLARQTKAW